MATPEQAAQQVLAGIPQDMTAQQAWEQSYYGSEDASIPQPSPAQPDAPGEPAQAPDQQAAPMPEDFARRPQAQPQQPAPVAPSTPSVPMARTGPARRSLKKAAGLDDAAGKAVDEQEWYLQQAAGDEYNAAMQQGEIYAQHMEDVNALQDGRRREIDAAQARLNNFSTAYTSAAAEGAKPAPSLLERQSDAYIASTVVQGLGALAMIVTRGNMNPLAGMAADIIRRSEVAIERDIKQKLRRIDAMKVATSMADRQLQTVRQMFDDDRAFMDYVKEVHMARAVDPLITQAKASRNAAAAAGAQAVEMARQAGAARTQAGLEMTLASQAQKNAMLRLQANKEAQEANSGPFKLKPQFAQKEAGKLAEEWRNTREFTSIVPELIQLRRELGPIARTGKTMAALMDAVGNDKNRLAKLQRYNSLALTAFTLDNDLGAALTETEQEFGKTKIGDPFFLLTGPKQLDYTMRQRAQAKVKRLQGYASDVADLTQTGRMQLASMYASLNGQFAQRRDAPAARRRGN